MVWKLPKEGDWVGFSEENKGTGLWYWGKVVRVELIGDKWRITLDTGSRGLCAFYLEELIIPLRAWRS